MGLLSCSVYKAKRCLDLEMHLMPGDVDFSESFAAWGQTEFQGKVSFSGG